MIISKSPLRITLAGGGTDLPSFYEEHDGMVISAAINKYVYVAVTKPFSKGIYLKYSESEKVENIRHIKHNIIRETLKDYDPDISQIEISTLADVPSGTGLGSSSSFTTALINGLYSHDGRVIRKEKLSEKACEIEIEKVGSPIGKQDQYISAYGGIKEMTFTKSGVSIQDLPIDYEIVEDLEENTLLFFTGFSRNANDILKEQDSKTKENNSDMITNLKKVKDIGFCIKKALINGKTKDFGYYMNEHWNIKKQRSGNMSNSYVNEWYDLAIKNGAIGGKLVGAGGGGFLMFYADDSIKLRKAMSKIGLEEMPFKFDHFGSTTI